jgi:hypothetical protein
VRVYLPLTLTGLAELHATGALGPAPLAAHAVTERLRRDWSTGDDEELEYAVLMAAAFDSLVAIDAAGATPRRVVVAADVDDSDVTVGEDETAVQVAVAVPLARCQAVHVDDPDAEPDVRAALAQLPAALGGDGPALGAVALTDHELLWFATQEIPDLL